MKGSYDLNNRNNPSRSALYEVIADKIEKMILNDEMHPDTKLPSETELADTFGVSRPVIREALNMLRERGLIASRQGAASVITEPDTQTLVKTLNRIVHMKNVLPMQVYQVRMVLETLCASLAAKSCTDSDIKHFRKINDRVRMSKGNLELRAKCDMEFHVAIAESTGNPLLAMILEALAVLMEPLIVNNLKVLGDADEGDLFHGRIIQAIESGDSECASGIMREHLVMSAKLYGSDFY